MIKAASLTLAAALLAAPAAAQAPLSGSWRGVGLEVQADGAPQTYPIRLRFEADGTGTIDYPSLDCGGTLTPLRQSGGVREFREKLAYGIENCVDGGTVGIWPKADKLFLYWTGEDTTDPDIMLSAVLRPASP